MAEQPASGPLVAIVMGSDSDLRVMGQAAETLADLGIPCSVQIISAHRTPTLAADFAAGAAERGYRVIIAGAGGAAHLAGAMAAHTVLPVIGVPISTGLAGGLDSLLSTVQMPRGVPVATVAVDGAANAALLAAQILATADPKLGRQLLERKEAMAREVEEKSARLGLAADPDVI